MRRKFPFNYRTIQRIKAEEYERFFEDMPEYDVYLNHLGEIRWMTEKEALKQHEFFIHTESRLQEWKKKLRLRKSPDLAKLSPAERQLRLQIHKYLEENYLGAIRPETLRWLPENPEYEISDEELENIPIPLEIFRSLGNLKKITITSTFIILVILANSLYFFLDRNQNTGQLLVQTNLQGARVYLDDLHFLGYSGKIIYKLPTGPHKISINKPGYVSIPKFQEIELLPDSLVTAQFQLQPVKSQVIGYLKIIADYADSKVFINNEYYGRLADNSIIALNEGQHSISILKDGYITIPAEKMIRISAGDTSIFQADQVPLSKRRRQRRRATSSSGIGSLEVTTNISGARIYIDGKDTGKETDYVFAEIPYGMHRISVVKNGYRSDPPEQSIRLSTGEPTAEAHFHLIKEFEQVTIKATPPSGDIFVDGELRGKGSFEGLLKVGDHRLSFGDLPGYKTPTPRKLTVEALKPLLINVSYFPELFIFAEVSDNGNIRLKNCELFAGYTFTKRGFTPSEEAGPEVVYLDKLNNYYWKLGYAFPYKNPKGNDALKLTFELPQDLNYEQKFVLKLQAASSRDNYPRSLSTKVDILIKYNGTILSYYYRPKFFEEIHGMETLEWDITSSIKPGLNYLEISTTDKNSTFYYIKRIEISN